MDITAVQFNTNDSDLYTGTNRGIINVWDIEAQKREKPAAARAVVEVTDGSDTLFPCLLLVQFTLKGHAVGVNTLGIFPYDDANNMLISGSLDTNVKIWDLR